MQVEKIFIWEKKTKRKILVRDAVSLLLAQENSTTMLNVNTAIRYWLSQLTL